MADVTKTIGATGRDYSTISSWEAALDNTGIYTAGDVAIGEMYDDADFDENITINGGGSVGLAGVILRAATGQGHGGVPGAGVRNNAVSAARQFLTYIRPLTVQEFEIDGNGNTNPAGYYFATLHGAGGTGDAVFVRCIAHHSVMASASMAGFSENGDNTRFLNCLVFNFATTGVSASPRGFSATSGTRPLTVRNCTAYNLKANSSSGIATAFYTQNHASKVFQNCVAGDVGGSSSGAKECFNAGASAVRDYNASDDTTAPGANSIASATLGFVSTTVGSEDFALLSTSDCVDAGFDYGTTNGVNIDIRGRDRDAEGDTWDIGAYEYVSAATAEGSGNAALTLSAVGTGEHTSSGSGNAALTLGAVGVGTHVASGSGNAALTLGAVGVGTHVASGNGEAALELSATGTGERITSGSTVVQVLLDATGVGETPAVGASEGMGTAALTLSATGAGEHLASGDGAAALTLNATGVGEAPAVGVSEGTGTAALTLDTVGVGEHVASGDSTAALALDAQAEGRHVAEGSADAGLTLGATGVGEAPAVGVSEGSGTAGIVLDVVAEGVSVRSASGTAALTLSVEAEGRTTNAGSGDAALLLGAAGLGETPALNVSDGFGLAALALSAVATGEHVASGDSEAPLVLSATAEGSAPAIAPSEGSSVVGLTLSAEGAGEVLTEGQAVAALAFGAEGNGLINVEGYGEAGLVLTVIGFGGSVERVWYLQINPDQPPFTLGIDDSGRYRYVFNITALKAPSTTFEEELKQYLSLGFVEPIYIGSKVVSKGTAIHLIKTPSTRGLYVHGRTQSKVARSSCQVVVKSTSALTADTLSREIHAYLSGVVNEELEIPEWVS